MKLIKLNNNCELSSKDVRFFGGHYSFFEKVKMDGIGSPRIIYDSGIEAFDQIKRDVAGETSFVNFELLKNGLLLRLNVNQRLACIGLRLIDIKEINLFGYRLEIDVRYSADARVVHYGELEIITTNGNLKFTILVNAFESILNYFIKKGLTEKFSFLEMSKPPEKDYWYLVALIDKLIESGGDGFE